MVEAYIPAIITASVALIAAVGAQFLNSWLTQKRDEKKYLKECYQNLFGPIYSRLWQLVQIDIGDNNPQSKTGHDEEWNKIFQMFDENKKYASAELIETFFEINPTYRYDDERIRFALFFFRELDLIMDSLGMKTPRRRNLKILINSLEIWRLLEIQFNGHIANLSYIYSDILPENFLKKTKKYMKKTDPGGPRTADDDFMRVYPYFKRNFFDKLVDIEEYEKGYINHYDSLYKKIQEKQKA
ncbi:hypothetical protein [Peribacillus frigoritolerans]|uniref:hypothetical protein n=1 Tax=Peribacillus frigoritolerans TaxID=450367 RepID=UPI003B8DC182